MSTLLEQARFLEQVRVEDRSAVTAAVGGWRPRQYAGWAPPSFLDRICVRSIHLLAVALALCSVAIDYAAQADLQVFEADEKLMARALVEGDPCRRLQRLINRRWRCIQRHHVSRDPLAAIT